MFPIQFPLRRTAAFAWLLTIEGVLTLNSWSLAQDITALPPPQLALPAERLMMEQVRDLGHGGEVDEALQLLERLLDESEHRLVAIDSGQRAATLTTRRYLPLAAWVRSETLSLLSRFPEVAEAYHTRLQGRAEAALQQVQASKDPALAKRYAVRFGATQAGSQFQLLLCDLYLEHGWGVAASQAAQQLSHRVRVPVGAPGAGPDQNAVQSAPLTASAQGEAAGPTNGTLSAPYVWQQLGVALNQEQRQQLWKTLFMSQPAATDNSQLLAAAPRLLTAAAMHPRQLDWPATRAWASQLASTVEAASAAELQQLLNQQLTWSSLQTADLSSDSFRPALELAAKQTLGSEDESSRSARPVVPSNSFVDWAHWSRTLEKYPASSDRVVASKPRVAETERGALAYFPVVKDGRVFVNEMTRIWAFDLQTGEAWPDSRSGLPLFDAHVASAAYLPLGYPMIGVPRGTLEIYGDTLYARLGSPITGRIHSRPVAAGDSASYLVGLDLNQQGSMLPGFPVHLSPPEFSHAEFDGPPVVWGERLLVAVAERDHVGLRRSVVAFHRLSGELLWRSGTLAAGTIVGGERANLISHQQLTMAGGRLFYNTNLGSIACLDPLTGETEWLVQYSTPRDNSEFPQPNRHRYRDLTPCLLSDGLIFCAPQDTPEIFALDALTGELVWSTDEAAVADIVQLLGTVGDTLVVSGDRLLWLNKRTGRIAGSFPADTTPLIHGALPSPRGLGRGTIVGEQVYWPTAGEILVFPATLDVATSGQAIPNMLARIPVQPGGSEGGNLLLIDAILLVASPSRLMAFPRVPR